ncbi:ABC TRANSPORTER-LIKE PROTEIN [Salix purpurea]|uniref:ABC TRANSPORTER-LIKE PROTEIN n=1 Tax=Salix purpurea TaxID=77065 RepID=A0A9Q0WXH7_SALPP|nr:ABC TRANSPORTER-LIKE PROTEIN [Salix purpurea]
MASSLPLQELTFLYPQTITRKYHHHLLSLSRHSLSKLDVSNKKQNLKFNIPLRIPVVRALSEDTAVIEKREREILKELNGNGNGRVNGSVERYVNGGVVSVEEGESSNNGSLMKYANGNGLATAATAEIVVEEEKEGLKEDGRKRRIEEIGKEDAWFKRAGRAGQQVEVSVAPGGRWSRFKTYSTIQRTLEIWGFVLTFFFKAWLNSQKFSYRGGVTEEKKSCKEESPCQVVKGKHIKIGSNIHKNWSAVLYKSGYSCSRIC